MNKHLPFSEDKFCQVHYKPIHKLTLNTGHDSVTTSDLTNSELPHSQIHTGAFLSSPPANLKTFAKWAIIPHVIILQLQTLQLTHITSVPRNFCCHWFSGYLTNSSLAVCLEPRMLIAVSKIGTSARCPGLHGSLSSCPIMTARESINTRRAHALQVRLFWCHGERT